MRIKRLLWLALAGSLCMSSAAWASESTAPSSAQEETAEEPESTGGQGLLGTVLRKLASIMTERTVTSDFKVEADQKDVERLCVGKSLTVKVKAINTATASEIPKDVRLVVSDLPDFSNRLFESSLLEQEFEQEVEIPGKIFTNSKLYYIQVLDDAGNMYDSDNDHKGLSVKPLLLTEVDNMTLEFKQQVFGKVYNENDKTTYQLEDTIIIVDDVALELSDAGSLTKVTIVRDPGEDAGEYAIHTIKSGQYPNVENIKIKDGPYSKFVIEKAPVKLTLNSKVDYYNTIILPADGKPRTIDLTQILSTRWDADKLPAISIGELSDKIASYFEVQPKGDGTKISFTLKDSDEINATFELPLILENKNYKYTLDGKENAVLTLDVHSRKTPETPSIDEIRSYLAAHPVNLDTSDTWDVAANADKDEAGKLSQKSLTNALNALNFIRYIAGLNEVTIDADYQDQAQAEAALLKETGTLTNSPNQPASVTQEFFDMAAAGAKNSLLYRWSTYRYGLADVIIGDWMADSSSTNIQTLKNRRWCLDPRMTATGIGAANAGSSGKYGVLYAKDGETGTSNYDFIAWPAASTPAEYFYGPWSVSLNNDSTYSVTAADLKVTLESRRLGETITLDSSSTDKYGKYLHYDNSKNGYGAVIIFDPDTTFPVNDTVKVTISGLKDKYGNADTIEYTVKLYSITEKKLDEIRMNRSSYSIRPEATYQLTATMSPKDAEDAEATDIVWSSSNTAVATVDGNGLVTGVAEGEAVITASLTAEKGNTVTATCTITVSKSASSGSSGGGGGSSSSSGGSRKPSSSSSSTSKNTTTQPAASETAQPPVPAETPEYVVTGNWIQEGDDWKFVDSTGTAYAGRWAAVYNPYAHTEQGQSNFDWFWFDADGEMATGWRMDADGNYYYLNETSDGTKGRMVTGWHLDKDGNYYYLNPVSDGTKGKMITGWYWIADGTGVEKCYYFNPVSDGTKGRMMTNTVVDGYTINESGEWTVDGVVQTREVQNGQK